MMALLAGLCERYEYVAIGIIGYIVLGTDVFDICLYLCYIMRVGCDCQSFHLMIINTNIKIAYPLNKLII